MQADFTKRTNRPVRLGIFGLGLIGGSMAKALARFNQSKRETFYEVYGFDPSSDVLSKAKAEGTIREGHTLPRIGQAGWEKDLIALKEYLDLDLLVLATPVAYIPDLIKLLSSLSPALLTDVGSIKAGIVKGTEGFRFIGGHPMAGSERAGYACASASLFENATYAFCEPVTCEADRDLLEDLAVALGARPLWLEADLHDSLVARVSHLPHALASALVNAALGSKGEEEHNLSVLLSAGGFRDITRIASSDPGLWAGISLESGPFLLEAIEALEEEIALFKKALVRKDRDGLRDFFARARENRALIPTKGVGPLLSDVQILVNIQDEPGVLAHITSLLGEAGINIHNVSIQDARLYEGGQVRIFIASAEEAQAALKILQEAGYDAS
jgi:prephenate dehydrogenase